MQGGIYLLLLSDILSAMDLVEIPQKGIYCAKIINLSGGPTDLKNCIAALSNIHFVHNKVSAQYSYARREGQISFIAVR